MLDCVKFLSFRSGDLIEVLIDEVDRPLLKRWQPFDRGVYIVRGFRPSMNAHNFRGRPEEFTCILQKRYGGGRYYKFEHDRCVGALTRMEATGTLRRLEQKLL